jgi:hypothetical protein
LTGVDPSSEENCDLANSSRHIPPRHASLSSSLMSRSGLLALFTRVDKSLGNLSTYI